MFTLEPPRKNSFATTAPHIRKLSNAAKVSPTTSNSASKKQSTLMRIKRRSMTLKHLRMENRPDIAKQSKEDKFYVPDRDNEGNMQQILLLKQIIRKKEERNNSCNSIKQQGQQTRPYSRQINKVSGAQVLNQQYDYYDMIVRDLISQIRYRKKESRVIPSINSIKLINKCKKKQQNGNSPISSFREQFQPECPSSSSPLHPTTLTTTIKFAPKRNSMTFSLTTSPDAVYQRKITNYIEFLFKVAFSNCIYNDLHLNHQKFNKIKVKIGKGNNSLLIKSLIKRRFWIQITNSSADSQFMWTQGTDQNFHDSQTPIDKSNKKIQQHSTHSILNRTCKMLSNSPPSCLSKILYPQIQPLCNQLYSRSSFATLSIYALPAPFRMSNHIPHNYIIGAKKILFKLMHWWNKEYLQGDPWVYLPKSYHVHTGDVTGNDYRQFVDVEGKKADKVWIVKPGENTNRGTGITVSTFSQISNLLKRKQFHSRTNEPKTFIIQQYLNPFLYHHRKFDIRHYLLITSTNGIIKGYWYREGYIRTSSEKFDLDELGDEMVHLTNDAIQKKGDNYGKYEPGNKLSYMQFQRYLDNVYPSKKYNFKTMILEPMKQITTDLMKACFQFIDPERKGHNFELFGLDFMVDHKFRPFLIECNANPCLEVSCQILQRIIPTVVQHTFRLAFDPMFPPPQHFPPSQRHLLSDRVLQKLNYELIFDQRFEGAQIRSRTRAMSSKFQFGGQGRPDEDVFQDEGQELDEDVNIQ